MTAVSRFLIGFLVTNFLTLQVLEATEPLLVIQSSSSPRLIQIVEQYGLPDPIAVAGLNTNATMELLQGSIDLRSTCGGFVYFGATRPHLVICMPLANQGVAIDKLPMFADGKLSLDASNVYQLEKGDDASKFFAMQSDNYLLFGDSREFLKDSVESLRKYPWPQMDSDLRIAGQLQTIQPSNRSFLLNEVMSLITKAPKTGLALNVESLTDHFNYGLHRYLVQSIIECKTFELSLNQLPDGNVRAQLNTVEDVTATKVKSVFPSFDSSTANLAFQFTSKVSNASVADVVSWAKTKERMIMEEISSANVADKSDLGASKKLISFLSEAIQQTVAHQKLDGTLMIGNAEGKDYLFGAVNVSNGKTLCKQLQSVIDEKQVFGMSCRDIRTDQEISQGDVVQAVIDLPKELEAIGFHLDDSAKLHVELFDNRLSVCVGGEAERIHLQSRSSQPSGEFRPLSLAYQATTANEKESSSKNVLPLDFRNIRLSVSLTEQGRRYELLLGRPKSSSSNASRQVSKSTN